MRINPVYNPLPDPPHPVINLQGIRPGDQLSRAVWHSYNPAIETESLKASPEKFYWFRSNYPLRREYPAYSFKNTSAQVSELLTKLGFSKK